MLQDVASKILYGMSRFNIDQSDITIKLGDGRANFIYKNDVKYIRFDHCFVYMVNEDSYCLEIVRGSDIEAYSNRVLDTIVKKVLSELLNEALRNYLKPDGA